jgi:hypothetical protein
MKQGRKETINVRVISIAFTLLALAIFKPFGLDAWQWQAYVHLLAIFALGVISCLMTEAILKYIIRMPRSTEQGVGYIIRRNLRFQFINTPLVALLICFYRHFVMSDMVESNKLSLSNFIETLLIIAFLSFAIGLYWRFKYRSRYLAAELEETRLLNEQLKKMTASPRPSNGSGEETASDASLPLAGQEETTTLSGTTSETIRLQISQLLYIEAVGNYVKVYHLSDGQVHSDLLRATSKQIEEDLRAYPMIVRCHRAFLVNLAQVEQIISHSGSMQLLIKHSHESIPVSRSNMAQVKDAIKRS